jgi:hypothetical protein
MTQMLKRLYINPTKKMDMSIVGYYEVLTTNCLKK